MAFLTSWGEAMGYFVARTGGQISKFWLAELNCADPHIPEPITLGEVQQALAETLLVPQGTQMQNNDRSIDTDSMVHDTVRSMNKVICKYSSSQGPPSSLSSLDEAGGRYTGAWAAVVIIVIERSWAKCGHHCCHRLGLSNRRRRVRSKL